MLANLSPLPNQRREKKDMWMYSSFQPSRKGSSSWTKASPLSPRRWYMFTMLASLCIPFREGLIDVVTEVGCWSVFTCHARCRSGQNPFLHPLPPCFLPWSQTWEAGSACTCDVMETEPSWESPRVTLLSQIKLPLRVPTNVCTHTGVMSPREVCCAQYRVGSVPRGCSPGCIKKRFLP